MDAWKCRGMKKVGETDPWTWIGCRNKKLGDDCSRAVGLCDREELIVLSATDYEAQQAALREAERAIQRHLHNVCYTKLGECPNRENWFIAPETCNGCSEGLGGLVIALAAVRKALGKETK